MRNTNRMIHRALAALGTLLVATSTPAAPGGARPSDPPPAQPPPPAGNAGAKPDRGPTVDDPRGDAELSKSLLEISAEKLRGEYAASLRDPRATLRNQSSYFI